MHAFEMPKEKWRNVRRCSVIISICCLQQLRFNVVLMELNVAEQWRNSVPLPGNPEFIIMGNDFKLNILIQKLLHRYLLHLDSFGLKPFL